ncbi:hypothetical protein, variant [Exophiala mesophila]|uniref:Tho complex subunit 7 n=1 Tax=Exophiala mesophila TaxID=212818 RepID=A0A0D1X1F7_EXOME|nr:hypothetical protein, variant [Exophiala mesophila]KIV95580.1 hypothetical protein, variant [Exophiala mesophila]
MTTFVVLDQAEEDKLHAERLLGIEERPFKRITKRLLARNNPINVFLDRTSEADGEQVEAVEDDASAHEKFLKDVQRFREEIILDFSAFESSIARIQYLRAANERERERYVAEKLKIEHTAQEVRDNIANLRIRLDEAQKTLAVRKTYDVLSDKITRNAALKPRDEQHVNIEKLKAEIEELERESQEHNQAWVERREQFVKVVEEAQNLRRVIRDEKEPEKEEEDQEDDENLLHVGRERDGGSNTGTPRPTDDAPTPFTAHRGVGTPRSNVGDATPLRVIEEDIDMEEVKSGEAEDALPRVVVEKPSDAMDMT